MRGKRNQTLQRLATGVLSLMALLVVEMAAAAGMRDASQADVYYLGGPAVDGAESMLVRTDFGITARVKTWDLPAGDAVTLWMVVFNNPEECANPTPLGLCSDQDIPNAAVAADVMYLAGNVVGGAGRSTFAGHKNMGDNGGSIFFPLLPDFLQPPGLINPRAAEVHLIVHTHGPVIPEYMPDMIQTFGGGCMDPGAPFIGVHFPEWGAQGPNTCESLQVSVHPAPNP